MKTEHLSTVGRRKDQGITRAHYETKRVKLMDPTMVEKCHVILKKLMAHPYAADFSQPSDPLDRNRPYYFCLKSKNMDLGTVRAKLAKNLYSNVDEFKADVRLTFSNAKHYSPFSDRLCNMAEELNTLFDKQWRSTIKSTIECRRRLREGSPHYSDSKEYSPRKRRCITPDQASRAEMLKTRFANTFVKDEKQMLLHNVSRKCSIHLMIIWYIIYSFFFNLTSRVFLQGDEHNQLLKLERKPLIGDRQERYNERRMRIQRQREAARIALDKVSSICMTFILCYWSMIYKSTEYT